MYGYIYLTVNLVNCKKYIGKHKSESFDVSYLGSGKLLKQAIRKYSKENFEVCLIERCNTLEELDSREKSLIDEYCAVSSNEYYNLKPGGTGGDPCLSPDQKKKARVKRMRHWTDDKRKCHSDTIKKITQALDWKERRSRVQTMLWKDDQYRINTIKTGKDTSRALQIFIFNANGKVVHECNGDFKQVCIDNNIPFNSLQRSLLDNNKITKPTKKYAAFAGWYARYNK